MHHKPLSISASNVSGMFGELLKLGFAVAQSTVAKYMIKRRDPSSQGWGTFLRNHAPHIAAMDLFVVPTISFNLLYVLVNRPADASRACLDQRNTAPHGRMDRAPNHGSVPLE